MPQAQAVQTTHEQRFQKYWKQLTDQEIKESAALEALETDSRPAKTPTSFLQVQKRPATVELNRKFKRITVDENVPQTHQGTRFKAQSNLEMTVTATSPKCSFVEYKVHE